MAISSGPFVPDTGSQGAELRLLAQVEGLAVLAIAVVLVHAAGDGGDALLGDRNVAGCDRDSIPGLGGRIAVVVHGGGLGHRSGVGVDLGVVVVVGVGLEVHADFVR